MKRDMLKKRFEAMIDSFRERRLRWLTGKGRILMEEEGMKPEEYEALMENILQTEMERKMIISELKAGAHTVSLISQRLGIPPKQVFRHLMALKRLNIVTISEGEEELEFQLLL
jgi:DNA-binding transcriptional ArsR family regulator